MGCRPPSAEPDDSLGWRRFRAPAMNGKAYLSTAAPGDWGGRRHLCAVSPRRALGAVRAMPSAPPVGSSTDGGSVRIPAPGTLDARSRGRPALAELQDCLLLGRNPAALQEPREGRVRADAGERTANRPSMTSMKSRVPASTSMSWASSSASVARGQPGGGPGERRRRARSSSSRSLPDDQAVTAASSLLSSRDA